MGTAFASDRAGLSLFVILAIAIQNIPEGTSVAIPMEEAGFSRTRQFWVAVGTSAPQPVGAVIAFVAVERINGLLPFSFAFAAGAMLALIAVEMLPRAYSGFPPSERMNGNRTRSRTALRAWERKGIGISGAPGMRTRTAAIVTTTP